MWLGRRMGRREGGLLAFYVRCILNRNSASGPRPPASYFISSKMRFGLMNESYMKGAAAARALQWINASAHQRQTSARRITDECVCVSAALGLRMKAPENVLTGENLCARLRLCQRTLLSTRRFHWMKVFCSEHDHFCLANDGKSGTGTHWI